MQMDPSTEVENRSHRNAKKDVIQALDITATAPLKEWEAIGTEGASG